MEERITNTYRYKRALALEYQYRVGARTMILWAILSLVLALGYLIHGAVTGQFQTAVIIAFFVVAVYYALYPLLQTNHSEKTLKKYFKGKIPETLVILNDRRIEYREGETLVLIEYADLKKVYFLKHGIYLRYSLRQAVALDREGFDSGTEEDLKALLRSKRPDLKIPE